MDELVAIVVAGPDLGVRVSVSGELEVGTSADADLQLTDPAVSLRHLRIFRDGQKLRVEGLDPGAGTQLNGEHLDRTRRLRVGDQLLVGATALEVVAADTVASLAAAPTSLRAEETDADFVPPEFYEDAPGNSRSRYGALASWTDSRVKLQTQIAAFGLLALSALAVYLFVF